MRVCMYVCMYVCVCVYVCVYMCVCMCVCVCYVMMYVVMAYAKMCKKCLVSRQMTICGGYNVQHVQYIQVSMIHGAACS